MENTKCREVEKRDQTEISEKENNEQCVVTPLKYYYNSLKTSPILKKFWIIPIPKCPRYLCNQTVGV